MNTVKDMFDYADTKDFKLFFSFDHNGELVKPQNYENYLAEHVNRKSYFKVDGRPLVSTFGGEKVTDEEWSRLKGVVDPVAGKKTLLIPGFFQGVSPANVFTTRSNIDGVFNWNSWQDTWQGKKPVSMVDDQAYMTKAHDSGRLFMMGISPLQYKNMNAKDNWYRRGEENLEIRLGQALSLQPDMLQFQSWNDAGESHYMGNLWNTPMNTSLEIQELVNDRPHTAYWPIMKAFIKVWKNGETTTANMVPGNGKPVEGAFWHHTLTVDASCGTDKQPKSGDIKTAAEDVVTAILMVAKGQKNLKAVVNVGGAQLDNVKDLKEGYNALKFSGDNFKKGGKVQLEVWDGSTMVGGGYGAISVSFRLLILPWTVLIRYRCLPQLRARLATTTSK
jgi:glucan endo-1,3-alpha-glucosidase